VTAELSQIAATLGFTLDELALNRAGKLSPQQSWEALKGALTSGGLMVMAVLAVLAMVLVARPTGGLRFLYYGLGLAGLALFVMLGWQSIAGAARKAVLHAEGPLDLHGTGKGTVAVIGRARIPVSHRAHEVLRNRGPYRIYYLGDANRFLSIEPAPEAAAGRAGTPP
jgi:hypothetical protein